ncbi:sensor histidine kinase [Streptomyces sp. P1-3]|uniref:sensor histidine kinase n=1 Tax=Streptomyces sp. P1-3 TaxID=3421658 RepID=UPI003D3674F5
MPVSALFKPLTRAVTYTRWLHLLTGVLPALMCGFVYPGYVGMTADQQRWLLVLPVPLLVGWAMAPVARLAEGLQARLLLTSGEHARDRRDDGSDDGASVIAAAPAASWTDRVLTAVWLVFRLEVGCATAWLCMRLPQLTGALVDAAAGGTGDTGFGPRISGHRWWYALLAPLPLAALAAVVVGLGWLMAAAAPRLLGPSAAERLAALEERTERLLEHNRLARELHDSIGHALTVAVVQAGAARAAGSPEFTDRALAAIEETGRCALDDLERVLRLLREDGARRPAERPGLADAERLLESARAAGTPLRAEITGSLADLPGPVSREGYRILQEALTNVLRHAGPVPVRVRIRIRVAEEAGRGALELDVRNPLPGTGTDPDTERGTATSTEAAPDTETGTEAVPAMAGRRTGGSGLRGIRERAALLGGEADTGPHDGQWRVRVRLPLDSAPRPTA